MPLVLVRYNPGRIKPEDMGKITSELPGIIAPALHVESNPDAHLTLFDIEVWANETTAQDVMGPYDIALFVFANYYPERVAVVGVTGPESNEKEVRFIDQAQHQIGEDLVVQLQRYGLTGLRFYVWPFLGEASFGEFKS
jgi:hypothetical protein